ncbi:MAG: hypothetical protein ACJA1A_001583 [Saprospiraceae bacterium]|jgi:hypothetical protein
MAMQVKNMINTISILAIFSLGGCIEDYVPSPEETKQELVVEGFIEAGEGSTPAYVLITKSIPFLSTIDLSTFDDLFVNEAKVSVNDGIKSVEFTELCLADLPPVIKELAAQVLGFDPDSTSLNICAYVDILDQLDRRIGGKYDLIIETEDAIITATTSIPTFIPLTKLRWDDPPGTPSDTLARLWVTIADNENEDNYYRFFTEENNTGFVIPFSSVTDDAFFNGQNFEFPLNKAERRDGEFDPNSFGLYNRGDSIRIKWMNIDEAHFDFWNTLEFSRNNTGPFGSFNRVTSNVDGALGVWGGYAVGYYEDVVPF